MSIKEFKPYTPGRRAMSSQSFDEVTKSEPERALTTALKKAGGRNNLGRITMRHRGGGMKRLYRIIDFKRDKIGVPGKVAAIEYDPNRSARIALIHYLDGEKRYILAPADLSVGDMVVAGPESDIKPGNALKLKDMPVGTVVHNIELEPGCGGKAVRSPELQRSLWRKRASMPILECRAENFVLC